LFKHALTHDVAYSTLLNERRKALHRIVGAAVEELYADRLVEQYETLAHHFEEGKDRPRALDYLVKSGEKAVAAYANADALTYYGRALDVAQQSGHVVSADRFAEIAAARANIAMLVGDMDGALADMKRVVGVARSSHDVATEARALTMRGLAQLWLHDFDLAETTMAEARALSDGASDAARFGAYTFSYMLYAILEGTRRAAPYGEIAASLVGSASDAAALADFAATACVAESGAERCQPARRRRE
jgi:hypothetical protein